VLAEEGGEEFPALGKEGLLGGEESLQEGGQVGLTSLQTEEVHAAVVVGYEVGELVVEFLEEIQKAFTVCELLGDVHFHIVQEVALLFFM